MSASHWRQKQTTNFLIFSWLLSYIVGLLLHHFSIYIIYSFNRVYLIDCNNNPNAWFTYIYCWWVGGFIFKCEAKVSLNKYIYICEEIPSLKMYSHQSLGDLFNL